MTPALHIGYIIKRIQIISRLPLCWTRSLTSEAPRKIPCFVCLMDCFTACGTAFIRAVPVNYKPLLCKRILIFPCKSKWLRLFTIITLKTLDLTILQVPEISAAVNAVKYFNNIYNSPRYPFLMITVWRSAVICSVTLPIVLPKSRLPAVLTT